MKKLTPLVLAVSVACSTGGRRGSNPPAPIGARYQAMPAPSSPTEVTQIPGDAELVQETPSDYLVRYKKSLVQRVDATHVLLPYIPRRFAIDHEDANYVYVRFQKVTPEEHSAYLTEKQQQKKKAQQEAFAEKLAAGGGPPTASGDTITISAGDFSEIEPKVAAKGVKFAEAGAGLPRTGQWRQNFALADVNGDGNIDIVAMPSRLSGSRSFHVFLGEGNGDFRDQAIRIAGPRGNAPRVRFDYGSVAVADFNGDGKPDVAVAIHGQGVAVFLQRPDYLFEEASEGLPPQFSAQGIAAFDVNGDGRPDLVVSQDVPPAGYIGGEGPAAHQVRVFLNQGGDRPSWKFDPDAIAGACFSASIFPMRLSEDPAAPARDLLTGCRALGAWGLAWDNDGKGHFSNVHELFKGVEQFAYHDSVTPGTFGSDHAPAYADYFFKTAGGLTACGLNVYYKRKGEWHKLVLWRDPKRTTLRVALAMGDLNGDGLDDIVMASYEEPRVRIFYQTPQGRFEESPQDLEPRLRSPAACVRIGDLNGDGRPDIVLGETNYSERPNDPGGWQVLLNQGNR